MTSGDQLRVRMDRSGGFAGIRLSADIDASTLDDDEARGLRDLVDRAAVFEVETEGEGPPPRARDCFVYRITVEDRGRERTIEVDEAEMPERCRPLVDWLLDKARRSR